MWYVLLILNTLSVYMAHLITQIISISMVYIVRSWSDSHRVRTNLTLTVTRVAFSPAAAQANSESSANRPVEPSASLQITGRVAQENAYVKLGAFHTLDVEANRDVRIEKAEWDSVALDRVQEASIPGRGAEVGAVVCGEGKSGDTLLRYPEELTSD